MPQFKDYPELTDLADDDALVILDVSDTTDSPAGSTKYVQASAFAPAGRVIREELARVTDPTGNITFGPGLDLSMYDACYIRGLFRDAVAATNTLNGILFNADPDATGYTRQPVAADNGAVAVTDAFNNSAVLNTSAGSSPANAHTSFEISIAFPAGSQLKSARSTFTSLFAADAQYSGEFHVVSNVAAPITQIDITSAGGGTGVFILYGERTA